MEKPALGKLTMVKRSDKLCRFLETSRKVFPTRSLRWISVEVSASALATIVTESSVAILSSRVDPRTIMEVTVLGGETQIRAPSQCQVRAAAGVMDTPVHWYLRTC